MDAATHQPSAVGRSSLARCPLGDGRLLH